MKLIKKYGLFIFWGVLILDCLLSFLNSIGQALEYRIYTKPLLLPILAAYFFVNISRSRHKRSKTFVYLALFIAWLGDLLLLKNDFLNKFTPKYQGDIYLIIGICLLLTAFCLYGFMFRKMNKINIKDCQEAFLSTLAMIVICTLFFKILNKFPLGHFKYLILVGMVVMTIVMGLAANVYNDKIRKNMAYQYFIPGTMIICISMGILIAYRFFLQDGIEFLPAVIVLTYGFGQMLVIRGFTKYLKA